MKRVILPLRGKPICGHSFGHPLRRGDLLTGREEGMHVKIVGDTEYIASITTGECSKCNKMQIERIDAEIDKLAKEAK